MIVNELDALEEFLVQRDVICVLGENRTHLLRNLFHLIAGFSTHHARENVRYTAQEVVIVFALIGINSCNGILKGWFCRIVYNLVCSLVITADSLHECWLIIFETDSFEWYCIVRCIVRHEEWVGSILYCIVLHIVTF